MCPSDAHVCCAWCVMSTSVFTALLPDWLSPISLQLPSWTNCIPIADLSHEVKVKARTSQKTCHSRVRVRVTLRLAFYHQSVGLGAKPFETHGQNFFFQLNTCSHSPYITSSLTRGWMSFTIAAGPRQRIHSWVRVPWDSRSYFTVSDSRLLFCRLLHLAGLRWKYSTPPPHRILSKQFFHYCITWLSLGPRREHHSYSSLQPIFSSERFLQSHYIATGLHVAVYIIGK
jgi:hypothetical protein